MPNQTRLPALLPIMLACCIGQTVLAATPPAALRGARQVTPLGGQYWLSQEKKKLTLLDSQGQLLSQLKLRSEALDSRPDGSGYLAVVIDQDQQRVQPLRIDPSNGRLEKLPLLPAQAYAGKAVCLYRDPQALLQLFVIGEEGQAEQWLLSGPEPRKLRSLALPPGVESCEVDDSNGRLLISEPGLGLWAYPADPERPLKRQAVLLQHPYGPITGGIASHVARAGQVWALDAAGTRRYGARLGPHGWQALAGATQTRPAFDTLAWGGTGLLARRHEGGDWLSVPAAVSSTTSTARVLPYVLPTVQTEPMLQAGDAADDPAIWANPHQPADSRILATNKKQGLLVYDMKGQQRQFLPVGRINNVDLRQGVRLGNETLDLAVATQRDDLSLVVFGIDGDGVVSERARIPTPLQNIYGVCVYQPKRGGLEVFVNDKDGSYLHYRLGISDNKLAGQLLRRFSVATQPEGCVADDQSGLLFFGEEKRGLWVTEADAERASPARLVLPVGELLKADVEGMGIYRGRQRSYLVVSSQGADRYEVLEASPPFRHRGSFKVGINAELGIDGSSETDGLDLSNANLGPAFPRGGLVVHDGHKRLPDGPQNFKYIPWESIEQTLQLE
ncbi:phytase [Chitinimonas naiadis]